MPDKGLLLVVKNKGEYKDKSDEANQLVFELLLLLEIEPVKYQVSNGGPVNPKNAIARAQCLVILDGNLNESPEDATDNEIKYQPERSQDRLQIGDPYYYAQDVASDVVELGMDEIVGQQPSYLPLPEILVGIDQ